MGGSQGHSPPIENTQIWEPPWTFLNLKKIKKKNLFFFFPPFFSSVFLSFPDLSLSSLYFLNFPDPFYPKSFHGNMGTEKCKEISPTA